MTDRVGPGKEEELIEEVADKMWGGADRPNKIIARDIIARIGQAYTKGELKLPGEVGRFPLNVEGKGWPIPVGRWNFIALKPEEE